MGEIDEYAQRLIEAIYRIARCRRAIFHDMLSDCGVTLQQFHLLLYIKTIGSITITDLSEKMLVSMPTASRMINTLCDLGMARKKKKGKDKRTTYIVLTPLGQKKVEEIDRRQRQVFSMVLKQMPPGELDVFIQATERVTDGLTAMLKEE